MSNRRANMNTNVALSSFSDETLQGFLEESKTWVDFKLKCGLPKSRRQDGIRAYLDKHNLDYSHLPKKGQSGMQQKSGVWAIPEAEFCDSVAKAANWSELLVMCGCEGFGNIGTVRRRIRELGLDVAHLRAAAKDRRRAEKDLGKDDPFTEGTRVPKGRLRKLLLQEREHVCADSGLKEWNGVPIPLKVVHLDGNPRNNKRENLALMCPNSVAVRKMKKVQG